MSFYELDRPAAPGFAERLAGLFTPLRNTSKNAFRSFTYGRMMRVMTEMDDATLARIGITRAQIPAHVAKCLEGDHSI